MKNKLIQISVLSLSILFVACGGGTKTGLPPVYDASNYDGGHYDAGCCVYCTIPQLPCNNGCLSSFQMHCPEGPGCACYNP
jgi:hypothetical protein